MCINIYVFMYSLCITSLLCKTRFGGGGSSVAIAFSTICIAITHLYIISIQIAIMSIVKPCLHITMKEIHSCYIYHSMKIAVICWLHNTYFLTNENPYGRSLSLRRDTYVSTDRRAVTDMNG